MNSKVLTIEDNENRLEIYINSKGNIIITLTDKSDEDFRVIQLEPDDVSELIKELKRLSKYI
jgi:cell shape-determining protein MreC